MSRHPDITITDDIEKFLFDIEYKIWKFFHIKIPSCGHYERYEQCCNDFREVYNYCDYMCFYGVSGCKRLLLSNVFFHTVRLINRIINKLRGDL